MSAETASAVIAERAQELHDSVRAERRHAQANRTFRADLLAKAINVVVRLLSIPLSIQLLGAEQYGLWLTVSSVLMWLNVSQLGFGGGLLNEIGKASAHDDRALMRRHIATAYLVFGILALLVFAAIVGISQTPLAPTLLGVSKAPDLVNEATALFLVAGALFAASLLTNAIGPVCLGLQEGYLSYAAFSVGSALSLVALVAVYLLRGSILDFAIAMSAPPLLAKLGLAVYVFGRRHRSLRPTFADVHAASVRPLLSTGGAVMLLLLGDLTILNSTNPLIAGRLGLAQVSEYAVPFSVFMIFASICQGMASAYQAAFSEASARDDWRWIRSTLLGTCKKGLIVMLAVAAGLAVAGPFAISVWTHGKVTSGRTLLIALGVYFILKVLSMQNCILFIALDRTAPKAALQIFVAAAHIIGFFALVSRFGLLAFPLAGGVAYLIDGVASFYILERHMQTRAVAAGTR
jgi:O-antigen/teichoic acid export membrane protein